MFRFETRAGSRIARGKKYILMQIYGFSISILDHLHSLAILPEILINILKI